MGYYVDELRSKFIVSSTSVQINSKFNINNDSVVVTCSSAGINIASGTYQIGGVDYVNQAVLTTSSPSFAGLTLSKTSNNSTTLSNTTIAITSSNGENYSYGINNGYAGSYVANGIVESGAYIGIASGMNINTANHRGSLASHTSYYANAGSSTCGTGGTIVDAILYNGNIYRNANVTITNSYMFKAAVTGTGGTLTNNWGLHLSGCAKSYIAGNLLIGSATIGYGAGVEISKTGLDSSSYGISNTLTTTLNNDITSETYAQSNWFNTSYIASTKTDSGIWATVYNAATLNSANMQGTITSLAGTINNAGTYIVGAGTTITNLYGSKSYMYHRDSDATITNSYMFHGSIAFTGATVTNNWGIHLTGCTKNYIEGTLLLSSAALEASQVGGLNIKTGTLPGGYTADQISICSGDVNGAGTAGLCLGTEVAMIVEADESKMSHKLPILHNGTLYYLMACVT